MALLLNGKPVTAGVDAQSTEAYDRIEYRFEKSYF